MGGRIPSLLHSFRPFATGFGIERNTFERACIVVVEVVLLLTYLHAGKTTSTNTTTIVVKKNERKVKLVSSVQLLVSSALIDINAARLEKK